MSFKLPRLPPRKTATSIPLDLKGIPTFNYKDVHDKKQIGRGAFSTLSVAAYKMDSTADRVVVKDLYDLDENGKRLLMKEATLLNSMHHDNVVKFKGISLEPHALMMEYVFFDFRPFDRGVRVNSLREFLRETASDRMNGMSHVIPK